MDPRVLTSNGTRKAQTMVSAGLDESVRFEFVAAWNLLEFRAQKGRGCYTSRGIPSPAT
jgi:hypothetical protein